MRWDEGVVGIGRWWWGERMMREMRHQAQKYMRYEGECGRGQTQRVIKAKHRGWQ